MSARLLSTQQPIRLMQTDWPSLAQAAKEQVVLYMQRDALAEPPEKLRLVVSLQLIPAAAGRNGAYDLGMLCEWLSLQCRVVEVTAGRCGEHRIYIEKRK